MTSGSRASYPDARTAGSGVPRPGVQRRVVEAGVGTTAPPRRGGQKRVSPPPSPPMRKYVEWIFRPRYAVLAGLLLTYIWRFHDLTGVVRSLRIAAICTVLSWAFLLVQPRLSVLSRAVRLPYVALFLAFSVWGGFSVPFALDSELAWSGWFEAHFKTVTFFLFVISCLSSFAYVRLAILVQVLGGAVLAFFYIKSGFPQFYTPVPMYDRNDFALVMNVALPMGLFWAFSAPSATARKLLWGIVLAFGACIMMGQSRGGFVTVAVTTLFTVSSVKGVKLRYRILPPILIGVSLFFLPAEVQDRLSTLLNPTEDYNYNDSGGRVEIWKRGLGYLNDHKVLGVGWNNFPVAEGTLSETAQTFGYAQNKAVHNSFLQVAVETGIPGFLLWVSMILVTMRRLLRLRRRLRKRYHPDSVRDFVLCADFLLVSLIGFCIGAQFLTMAYFPILFGQVALAAGLELSVADWKRKQRAPRRAAIG